MTIEQTDSTKIEVIGEQQTISPPLLIPSAQDPEAAAPTYPRCSRRSIFDAYWKNKSSRETSSCTAIDNGTTDPLGRSKRSTKFEPSYLGVYSFAPSPSPSSHRSSPPSLSPIDSTDSMTSSPPLCLKSILRRCRSSSNNIPSQHSGSSDSCVGVGQSSPSSSPKSSQRDFCIHPLPFHDDATSDEGSRDNIISKGTIVETVDFKRPTSMVRFDPTITVHECVDDVDRSGSSSSGSENWFSENELRAFMNETMNLCRTSAVDAYKSYCLSEVKKAYETAHEVGIKCPVLSSAYSTHRALFAEEVLYATDEDTIVHDGSLKFFQLMKEELQRVLIVDTSQSSRKLFRRHILAMFPHAQIDVASSGEDVLDKIDVCYERGCINYDLVVVEEHLHQSCDEDATTTSSISLDLTGSEILRLLNEMEVGASNRLEKCAKAKKLDSRKSLKIGVSVSLGRDCESLRNRGGADLFWSKPPPKPSNLLRNQVLNALLSKRGSAVFICGC
ncbi:hypothetical protein ACHAXH_000943 [Discostella pseudostelligera]